MNVSIINSVSKERLESLVKASTTFSQVLRALGYHERGGRPWNNLKKRLEELNIDTSHFKGRAPLKLKSMNCQTYCVKILLTAIMVL